MWRRVICWLLAVWLGALTLVGLSHGVSHEAIGMGVLSAVLSIACAVAASPRYGWLIPCFVVGIMFGSLPSVRTGTIESQMWETVRHIVEGAVFGLVIGALVDSVISDAAAHPPTKL